MAKHVFEIANPDLFSVRPSESVSNALLAILAKRITAAPVLADRGEPVGVVSLRDLLGERSGVVSERMSAPPHVIASEATITDAARYMAEHDVHHLVVVNVDGRAVGLVSSLDVIRAMLGVPVHHPAAFAHVDPYGFTWTDPAPLEIEHAHVAPNGPGLLVLIRGEAGQRELPLWAESANNVQTRIHELLSAPQSEVPFLARILERERGRLRFVASAISDAQERERALRHARELVAQTSGLPQPSKRSML